MAVDLRGGEALRLWGVGACTRPQLHSGLAGSIKPYASLRPPCAGRKDQEEAARNRNNSDDSVEHRIGQRRKRIVVWPKLKLPGHEPKDGQGEQGSATED